MIVNNACKISASMTTESVRCCAFIQARTGSARLPGKVLLRLSGEPLISHCIKASTRAEAIDRVVLCTSTLEQDDVLEDIATKHQVACFRGSHDDVLRRFLDAHESFPSDHIVRLTGDDPLLDSKVIDKVIKAHIRSEFDYTSNIISRTWPRGLDTEVFTSNLLKVSADKGIRPEDREHVTIFARTHPEIFRLQNISAPHYQTFPNWRLCVDTIDDYKLMCNIFDQLSSDKGYIEIDDVIQLLSKRMDLIELNNQVEQKQTLGKVF